IIVADIVAKAPSDGYTLLYAGTSFMFGPFFQQTPYDPIKNFAPISIIAKTTSVLAVNPSVPVKTVKELIDLAKSKPGQLNYGSATIASGSHVAMEFLKPSADINMTGVAYRGGGPGVIALLGGEVQALIAEHGLIEPHAKAGALRALAVTSRDPSPL